MLKNESKSLILFVVLWIHISILDLFVVTYNGPVFLIAENTTLKAIVTHFLLAALGTCVYVVSCRFRLWRQNKEAGISDKIWLACSAMLLGSILFMII